MDTDGPPKSISIWPSASSDAAAPSADKAHPDSVDGPAMAPMSEPSAAVLQGTVESMTPAVPVMAGQQVVYVPLKFSPQVNFRKGSYMAMAIAVAGAFAGTFIADTFGLYLLGETMSFLLCCGGFTSAVFLDAAYYKGKADWQRANGMSSTGSTFSMVIEALFGIVLLLAFLVLLSDLLLYL